MHCGIQYIFVKLCAFQLKYVQIICYGKWLYLTIQFGRYVKETPIKMTVKWKNTFTELSINKYTPDNSFYKKLIFF